MTIHLACKTQIGLLLTKKVTIPVKYLDSDEIFLKKSAKILPKQTEVSEHVIELEKGNQPPYKPIYSLGLVKLKIFKTYIEINLANGFIKASKSLVGAPILLTCKHDSSFYLYINYSKLNNLIIKNWYPLLLIIEPLHWLS